MAGNKDGTMPFREDCPTLNPPVDDHEAAANQENLPPTSQFTPGPGSANARAGSRAGIPGQLDLPPIAVNGQTPASPELSCSLVDSDTGSPASVRGPLTNDSSANAVRKRPPSAAHGTSGHTSQAVGDTSNRLPLTSSETDVERPDDVAPANKRRDTFSRLKGQK